MAFAQRRDLMCIASLGWASARLRPMKCGKRVIAPVPETRPVYSLFLQHAKCLLGRVRSHQGIFPNPAFDEFDTRPLKSTAQAGDVSASGLRPVRSPGSRCVTSPSLRPLSFRDSLPPMHYPNGEGGDFFGIRPWATLCPNPTAPREATRQARSGWTGRFWHKCLSADIFPLLVLRPDRRHSRGRRNP